MSSPGQTDPQSSTPKQGQGSLAETIDRANQAIAASRAEIARSRALSRSEADLARQFDRLGKGESGRSPE
jgi:hypothetical protein